jgi:hypothetical protein
MSPNETYQAPLRLSRRDLLIATLIVLVALAIRFIAVYQRALYDDMFIPHSGVDPQTYLNHAYGLLDGTWPTEPYFFHPLSAYLYAGIMLIVGRSIASLYFVLSLLDAFTCGVLVIGGCLLTRKNWGGWLAGTLYAIYPVAIYYSSALRIDTLAAIWTIVLIVLMLWQRESLSLWRTVLLGIFAGFLMTSRMNLIPLVAAYGLWLLLLKISWRQRIIHSLLYGFIAISVVAPFTLHNYQASGGKFIPIATTGPRELYWANHRDSITIPGRRTPALDSINFTYMEALWIDIQVAPEQFVGLLSYKAAMFWRDLEFPATPSTGFPRTQLRVPILNMDPLSHNYFSFFALLGLVALWYKDRKLAFLFGSMVAWIWVSYILTFAISRIRYPVIGLLLLLSVYALHHLVSEVIPNLKFYWRRYLIPLVAIAGLLAVSYWLTYPIPKVPFKRSYQALPADAIALNIAFGDELILRGWRPFRPDIWPPAESATVDVFETYMVELFWELEQPTDIEYQFYLAYFDGDIRYSALDRVIGTVSFPHIPTNLWDEKWGSEPPMQGEIVGIRLDDDVPTMRSGRIEVGVWYWDENGQIRNVLISETQKAVTLQTLAVIPLTVADRPQDIPPVDIVFGEQIVLRGFSIPQEVQAGETISITFYWEALSNIATDYRQFLHLMDENETLVSQHDAPPLTSLFTSNWPLAFPLHETIQLTMPAEADSYYLYTGLYNDFGRLSVDAPDNRLFLGEIKVAEHN